MSRFETTFRNAVANAERDVLIEQIRSNPQMSLVELGKLATGDLGSLLKVITIGDILRVAGGAAPAAAATGGGRARRTGGAGGKAGRGSQRAAGGGGGGRRGRPKASEAASSGAGGGTKRGGGAKGAAKEVDTRTPSGRAEYDQAMLGALKSAGGTQSAPELANVVGGTPLQVRTSLGRLIEAGLVSWTGQARGTRYNAV